MIRARHCFILVFALLVVNVAYAANPTFTLQDDPRYCGKVPERDEKGRFKRSGIELRRFLRVYPCPISLQPTTRCKGWDVDHTIPLASGGCDTPVNMQWLPNTIKNCTSSDCKDRWERLYHAQPRRRVPV